MEEEKIVLDRKSFEALAVDSRVRMLKSLRQRRKTLSELSGELGLAVSGVKEHLETLEKAGLIRKIDDGHKWKYYELTRKGSEIITPKELRVWVLLSISTLALILSALALLQPAGDVAGIAENRASPPEADAKLMGASTIAANCSGSAAGAPGEPDDNCSAGAQSLMAQASALPHDASESGQLAQPSLPLAIAAISGIAMLACLAVLVRNRLGAASP